MKKIEILLEKYYNGETSLDEEKILQDYFNKNPEDDKFVVERDVFLYNKYEQKLEENIPDISDEIWNRLKNPNKNKYLKNKTIPYLYLRIASVVLLLIGTFFIFKNQLFNSQKLKIVDTYHNPEDAYNRAKETLLYVSAMLNKGTEHMQPIYKVNKETQKLNKLSTFNLGLNELSPLRTYKIADKYIKQ